MDGSSKRNEGVFRAPLFVSALEYPATFPKPTDILPKTRLLSKGEHPNRVGLMVAGIVKLSNNGGDSPKQGFSLHSSGYWVGSLPFALAMPSLHDVDSVTTCAIIYFGLEEFRRLASTDSWVIHNLFMGHSEQLAISQFREARSSEGKHDG